MNAVCVAYDSKCFHADNRDSYISDFVDAQADLSLPWAHMSEGTFGHGVIHIMKCVQLKYTISTFLPYIP